MLFLKKLWHSPTFTAWGNKAALVLRLVFLLPFALHSLDDVQFSAWLLFGSISFFGLLLSHQASLAFSRMFALGMGGATDLSAFRPGEVRESATSVNWSLLSRLYQTLQVVNIVLGFVAVLVAFCMGYFSLSSLLEEYALAQDVWYGFFTLLGGIFISECFRKYSIVLRGLNQVALTNRWEALFSALAILISIFVLSIGGGIMSLIFVHLSFDIFRVIRMWWLLNYMVEPKFNRMLCWGWDSKVFAWVWEPVWRGVVLTLANRGGHKFGVLLLARQLDPATLSSILIVMRLLEASSDFATAPVTSHMPRFSRLMGANLLDRLRVGVLRALKLSQYIEVLSVLAIGFGAVLVIQVFELDVKFPSLPFFFCLSFLYIINSSIRRLLMIPLIGNRVVAFKMMLVAFLLSITSSLYLIPEYYQWGFIISSFFPIILSVNITPLKECSRLLLVDAKRLFVLVHLIPMCILVSVLLLVCLLPVEMYFSDITKLLKFLISNYTST